MKKIWAYVVDAITKDDLLERSSCVVFGGFFLGMGIAILIDDIPNEFSMHTVLTSWVVLTLFALAMFFGFLANKKGYKTKILNTPTSGKLIVVVLPAVILTIILRLCGLSGREYLDK